jgi:hypothetical protein
MLIKDRLASVAWDRISADLDERGWATTGKLLVEVERQTLIAAYGRGPAVSKHGGDGPPWFRPG